MRTENRLTNRCGSVSKECCLGYFSIPKPHLSWFACYAGSPGLLTTVLLMKFCSPTYKYTHTHTHTQGHEGRVCVWAVATDTVTQSRRCRLPLLAGFGILLVHTGADRVLTVADSERLRSAKWKVFRFVIELEIHWLLRPHLWGDQVGVKSQ